MKIQTQLLVLLLLKTTFTMLIALLITSYLTREALETAAKEKLAVVMEARNNALSHWTANLQAEMTVFSTAPVTVEYLKNFTEQFEHLGNNAQTLLQQNYLVGHDDYHTPLPSTLNAYETVHQKALPFFKRRYKAYGWYDIFLIDTKGNVVFSLQKEPDFATNLQTGAWHDTGLARAVLPLLHQAIPLQLSFADYTLYQPSNMQAASFLAMPVFDETTQQFLGVVAIQLPINQMNDLMNDRSGMGDTGETIVIGKDGWMLTESRFIKDNVILKKQVETQASTLALAGKPATLIAPDYRGIGVLEMVKSFTPFPNAIGDETHWGLIAKIQHTEVLREYHHIQNVLLWMTLALIVIAISLGVFGAQMITNPLERITKAITDLANGKPASVPELNRLDEIGEIANAAETFRKLMLQMEHEHWLGENINALTSAVSMQSTVNKAAERVLHLLCELLDVAVGAVYLLEDGRYQRIGSHGLARSNQAQTEFERGVGLLGQCAQSNQAIVLSPVPEGLIILSTGLGEFAPNELIIYPIEHKSEVLALIELAATHSLTLKQHAFLKAATTALGLYFANLQAAEHNSQLLLEITSQSAELKASANYVRSLIEASLDPLVTIDSNGKIMDVNTATETITGVGRAELIGSDFCNYFIEPDKARTGYQLVFSKGFVADYELAICHRSGTITDVLYNASVYYDNDNKVAGIFAAARDITGKKKAEEKMLVQQKELLRSNAEMQALTEELRTKSEEMQSQNEELRSNQEELRAQQEETLLKNQLLEYQGEQLKQLVIDSKAKALELQQANQYKSEFLANMSHELRTPLNSILILSKNLADNDDNNLSSEQIESASVITESGTQLLTLINDILDLSKIESGKLELVNEAFALTDMTAYLRRIFSPQAEKKQLTLTIEIAPDMPERIETDKQRLTQILSNLLSNAIKFTESGFVKVRFSKNGDDLHIDVLDTGIGIPVDKQEQIFGAFQQLDGSTSRKYGGSGLGLAISRNLSHLLGGEISINNSSLEQGSHFVVLLYKLFSSSNKLATPLLNEQTPSAQTVVPAPIMGGNILLIEDDTRLLAILGRMISTLGFTPLATESAEQALSLLPSTQITGIFLDLGLPKMSGMAFLKQLKTDESTRSIPIFIISGTSDTGAAKELGALGFLKKPVTRDAIIAALKVMSQLSHELSLPQILLIESQPSDRAIVEKLLDNTATAIIGVATGKEALERLQTESFAVVILDLQLPDMNGFDWIYQAKDKLNPPPIIIYSDYELTDAQLFELKGVTETIVMKDTLSDRLREEVLHALCYINDNSNLENPPIKGKKLLLVDDDARNLYALTKVLRNKGFSVDIAADSINALALLTQGSFDVLLTDIMMPQIDGYELIRRVRALGYDTLPIIAITAKAMQGDEVLCLQAGANAYLAKPVDIHALIKLIDKLSESV